LFGFGGCFAARDLSQRLPVERPGIKDQRAALAAANVTAVEAGQNFSLVLRACA
jgi:hypothetical protein